MAVCNRLQIKIPIFFLWFSLLLPLSNLFFGIHASLASGVCLSDQRSLLMQLHSSLVFNGITSTKLVRWNFSADCCEWAGVTCDGGGLGRVIGLNLNDESISGGLENSNALFSLQYLQNLDLSFNNFNTSIPQSFANLSNLVSLNLSNAGFVGQIPVAISRMTTLVTLDLSSRLYYLGHRSLNLENPNLAMLVLNLNRLIELHLDGVNISSHGNEWCRALSSSLPNLQVLSLCNCFLSGPIDSSLVKLPSLSVIRLNGNNLSAPVPEFFANFSNLKILSLSDCSLQGKFPPDVFQVPTLEILDLSYNIELWGSLPDDLQKSSLKTLVLSNTNYSGSLPDSIGTLGNLSRIELAACKFNGLIPMSIAKLTELVYLDFSSNSFSGPIPSFSRSKQLVYIDFSHNQLSGEILSTHFEGLWNLLYIDLRFNSLSGSIPPSLFAIPSLQKIQLSFNQFTGQLPEFSGASSSSLDALDLSSNKLEGPIPISIFDIKRLHVLLLSSNKFNGTIQLDRIQKLRDLHGIDLSYNNLTVENASKSTSSSFPQISTLKLASCKLRMFPNLSNQSKLTLLDLSDNQITGVVPSWIWEVGSGSLLYLNLSHNLLEDLEQPHCAPNLAVLDLHYNRLKGQIPTFPPFATYVDYSSNNFTSVIPDNFGTNLSSMAIFLSLSNNSLTGVIPESICNATFLQVLDLSDNGLNGRIPSCLIERSKNLGVLNLRKNNFGGNIQDNFPANCHLKTLDMSRNLLEGKVPQSLINCNTLEVLDLGSNKFNDTFPCLLRNMSSLRVLVLRDNNFYGNISCTRTDVKWTNLQIVDIASNNFSGRLPNTILSSWKAMMGGGNETHDYLKFEVLRLSQLYYQDSITVISKGLEMNLVKILTIFTYIDVSHNKFEGLIPENLGQLNSLIVLNLSHNALVGQIPSALGSISQLESLDLSDNKLSGEIPQQLADLTFLSVLNLSYNKLVGKIPTSTQLQSFSASSFANNKGLFGPPLTKTCTNISTVSDFPPRHGAEIKWNYLSIELGYVFGLGIVVLPLMLWKRWRICYYKHIDGIIVKMFPKLCDRIRNSQRRRY
ncbi:receptor-like protein 7 [Manihot esculenta]|uniref:Leucine-rich repeat-containing N-terminal plant-type domain-containing protein n=1 Tax=Manihot esculenta TaxID=3983 RepID=A0A2C9VH47_MANES|nr:receptor-like protein 7 [Manihot esculenta]OAY43747.1 hypothetical protein MANES_08G094600v8 [Manihot esculenta]